MKRSVIQVLGGILLCLLLLAGCAKELPVAPFSQQPADLVDPALVRGVLPNGFQYVLLENHTPKDRVSMHLNVFAGSAHETDQEQGIAHYLEHMLFNGSTHFKPGELIEFFQSIGMGFGADANASTSYFTTIYDLNLPKAETHYLEDALVVLQDYAKGALLLEEEVNRERGIILAEKRERDSVFYQMFKKELAFRMPGSLLTRRHPIGLQNIIEQADSKLLRQFYQKWYRPDNMMLVAVGDFDTKNLESLIQKTFTDISSPKALKPGHPSAPDIAWEPHEKGVKAFYLHDPEAQTTRISIECIEYRPFVQQTLKSLKREILQDMGSQILSQRLIRAIRHQKSAFSSGGVFAGQFLHNMFLASIEGRFTNPDHWQKGIKELEHLLRQALIHGFTKEELARTKANLIAAIRADAKQSQTRKTPVLARQILSAVNKKRLFLSPAQREKILVPFIENLNLEQVYRAFQDTWVHDHRLILVTGNVKIPENDNKTAVQRIADTYNQATDMGVTPLPVSQLQVFPYLPVPGQENGKNRKPLAKILRQKTNIHNTGITTVAFENQTHLAVKNNSTEKKQMAFSLVFGDGLQSQPSSMPGLGVLAGPTVDQSGFGRMDADQLEQALAGHNVSMDFSVDENFFSLNGTADSDELELVFQLVYTFLQDPGFSSQALELAKTRYEQDYRIQKHTTDGIYRIKGTRFLAGGDPRFGLVDPKLMEDYSLDDIKNWLGPYIRNTPVEFCVAGDVDPQKVIELAKTYLGGLNHRNSLPGSSGASIHFPRGKHLNLSLDTRIEKDMIRLCFPTDDYWDIRKTRRLSVLARIFSERMRKTVRENLGAVYSPYAYNHPSRAYKGYGVFQAVAAVAPGETDNILQTFENIAWDLYQNGVQKKELDLIMKPLLQHLKVVYKTNDYWLNSVMKNSFRFPQKLEWPIHIMEDYGSISAPELTDLARQYLTPDHSAKIIISRK